MNNTIIDGLLVMAVMIGGVRLNKGVICLGEAVIDLIPTDETNIVYEKSPGGAPANVAVGLAKLGVATSFIGTVGDDLLGHFLKSKLDHYGVNTCRMSLTKKSKTGLTFVKLSENGERNFDFYINPGADQFLTQDQVDDEKLFCDYSILHIGSISMIHEPARKSTNKAIQLAKKAGLMISYDPNLRLQLWENEKQARENIISVLPKVDILKVSHEELTFITAEKEISNGLDVLNRLYNIPLIFITLGDSGCITCFNGVTIHVPPLKVQSVDTTGAGDGFVAGALYGLSITNCSIRSLTSTETLKISRFANVSGAITASRKGAMSGLPNLSEVRCVFNGTDKK